MLLAASPTLVSGMLLVTTNLDCLHAELAVEIRTKSGQLWSVGFLQHQPLRRRAWHLLQFLHQVTLAPLQETEYATRDPTAQPELICQIVVKIVRTRANIQMMVNAMNLRTALLAVILQIVGLEEPRTEILVNGPTTECVTNQPIAIKAQIQPIVADDPRRYQSKSYQLRKLQSTTSKPKTQQTKNQH